MKLVRQICWGLLVVQLQACSAPGPVAPPADVELESQQGLLAAPPLVGRPTANSAILQLVAGNNQIEVEVRLMPQQDVRARTTLAGGEAHDLVLEKLQPGTEYRYELIASGEPAEIDEVHTGRFVTQRPPGSRFRFAVISDTHLPVAAPEWLDPLSRELFAYELHDFLTSRIEIGTVIRQVMASIRQQEVDFIICLGDMLHNFRGFNDPFPSALIAEMSYLDLRAHLGQTTAEAAFFAVIGNWDGESGWQPRVLSRFGQHARKRLIPNPLPNRPGAADHTYLPGGSTNEDFYAWHWGDALFIVLNVMSYTPTKHTLQPDDDGTADDWTLGPEQFAWLETSLASSQARHKMIFIHHPVGGNGGDEENSAYGRGGGRAAGVGEQAKVHALMRQHGVQIFFYGHDHVATDMVVDGIHYTLPSSAGAPWKFDSSETGYEDYQEASGYALVEVGSEQVTVELMDLEGLSLLSYTVGETRIQ